MIFDTKMEKQQGGAALAICLLLLVVMTISGVATLNQSRVSARVSSNAQQKAIAFETAESVINMIESSDTIAQKLLESKLSSLSNPVPMPQFDEVRIVEVEHDQFNSLGISVDVNAEAEIQFCEERVREGTEISAEEGGDLTDVGYQFDIRAISTISNTRTRADHVLRVEIGGKRFGASGDCITPGT